MILFKKNVPVFVYRDYKIHDEPRTSPVCNHASRRDMLTTQGSHVAYRHLPRLSPFRFCLLHSPGHGGGAGVPVRDSELRGDWILSCKIHPRRRSI